MSRLTAFLLLLACPPAFAKGPAPPISYEIVSVEGGELTAGGRTLGPGLDIPRGVTVRLTEGGRAVVKAGASGAMMLKGPSEVRFDAGRRPAVFLRQGGLLSVLPFLKGGYTVRTKSVVAAVRGTDFYMEVRTGGETYLCVCDGKVEVFDTDGRQGRFKTTIAAEHHKSHRFNLAHQNLLQADAAMEFHSDEEIASLKALLGVKKKGP